MVETSENQKKMNKVLQDLLKSGFNKAETGAVSVTEEREKERERERDKERERDRDRDDRDDRKRKRREREESSGSREKRSKTPDVGLDSLSAGSHQVSSVLQQIYLQKLIVCFVRLIPSMRSSSGVSTWLSSVTAIGNPSTWWRTFTRSPAGWSTRLTSV